MSYFNAGALLVSTNERPRTKKALREAIASEPGDVIFDGTSIFEDGVVYRANEIPAGVTVTVVGPDPYTSRKWYASVVLLKDGKVKVS